MRSRLFIAIVVIALLLYWIVQAPIQAADTIHGLFVWILDFLQMLANRIVTFLDALL